MKTFKDWLTEGDQLYNGALGEYQALEAQIEELERKLAIKKEVTQRAATSCELAGPSSRVGTRKPPMNPAV